MLTFEIPDNFGPGALLLRLLGAVTVLVVLGTDVLSVRPLEHR